MPPVEGEPPRGGPRGTGRGERVDEERGGMSQSVEDRDIGRALDAFADLPAWLSAVMVPGRVADALRRAVPELRGPHSRLTTAVVDRLRAKGAEWHVHCRAELVTEGRPSELTLIGRLLPPGSAPPEDTPVASFGEPG